MENQERITRALQKRIEEEQKIFASQSRLSRSPPLGEHSRVDSGFGTSTANNSLNIPEPNNTVIPNIPELNNTIIQNNPEPHHK